MAAFTTLALAALIGGAAGAGGALAAKKLAAKPQGAPVLAPAPVQVLGGPMPPTPTAEAASVATGTAMATAAKAKKRAASGSLLGEPAIGKAGTPTAGTAPKTLLGY